MQTSIISKPQKIVHHSFLLLYYFKIMQNNGQSEKEVRLKTCFSTFQSYCESHQPNPHKNLTVANQLSSKLFQYRSKNIVPRLKRRKVNTERSCIQKKSLEQSSNLCSKTGFFDISKLKIHQNQRYSKTAGDQTVVKRNNFKNYLKLKVQQEFHRKLPSYERQQLVGCKIKQNSSQIKKLMNSKLQQILSNLAKTASTKNKQVNRNNKKLCMAQLVPEKKVLIKPKQDKPQPSKIESKHHPNFFSKDSFDKISAWQTYQPNSQR